MTTTTDLRDFGLREMRLAAELLTAYCENPPACLGDGVCLMMNTTNGYVFLTDEDFNVAMMNDDKLEQSHACPECFAEELPESDCCQRYLRDVWSYDS